MKIIHFCHRFWPCLGGSENYLLKLSEALIEAGHDVKVATTHASSVEALWRTGEETLSTEEEDYKGIKIKRFPIRYLPCHSYSRKILSYLPLSPALSNPNSPWVPKMEQFARETEDLFDVVHCTALPYDGVLFPALELSKRKGCPLICTPFIHLGIPGDNSLVRHYSSPQQINLLKQCQAIIVQTQTEANFLLDKNISKEKIHIIPQGLDEDETSGGRAERFRAKHNCRKWVIAHIAALCEDKGTLSVLEAYSQLPQKNECTLVLLGKATHEAKQQIQSMKAQEPEGIIHLERIPDKERNALLAAMDLLLLPSKTDTFGRVFLEAWSYRKPVIGAEAGGIVDVIDHEKNGLLVPFGDSSKLSQSIHHLFNSDELRTSMGQAGYEKLIQEYQWETIKSNLLNVLTQISI